MKISNRSLYLLILNIVICPLLGNNSFLGFGNIETFCKLLLFLLPGLYFLSFIIDIFKNKEFKFKIDSLTISVFLLILSLFISLLFGIQINFNSITNLITFCYISGFIYTIHTYTFNEKDTKKILISILITFIIICIIGIIQYAFQLDLTINGIQKYPGALGRIKSTMSVATILDKYITLNLLILFYILFKSNKKNWYIYLLLVLGTITLAFTYSRSGIITFYMISIIFMIIYLIKKQWTNGIITILLIVLLYSIPGQNYLLSSIANYANNSINKVWKELNLEFLSPINNTLSDIFIINQNANDNNINTKPNNNTNTNTKPNSNNNNTINKKPNTNNNINTKPNTSDKKHSISQIEPPKENGILDDSNASRKYYQTVAKRIIQNHKISGIGIGNYNYIYKNQNVNDYIENDLPLNSKYLYPHNMYYHFTAETGLLGLYTFISCLIIILIKSIKNKNTLISIIFFTTICLYGTTESIFYMKDIAFWLIIVYTFLTKKVMKVIHKYYS